MLEMTIIGLTVAFVLVAAFELHAKINHLRADIENVTARQTLLEHDVKALRQEVRATDED